jgi:hypothetical protein
VASIYNWQEFDFFRVCETIFKADWQYEKSLLFLSFFGWSLISFEGGKIEPICEQFKYKRITA